MAARLPESLTALLPEHADLRSTRLAIHHTDDLRVSHEWGARQHFAAVFFQEQDLVKRHCLADLGVDAFERDDGPWIDLYLSAAGLNDCEHDSHPPPALDKGLYRSEQRN